MKGMEQRNSSIEIYRSPEGNIELNVKLENDTVWLTQSQMAELFGRDRTVISRHVNNCFKEGELDKSLVCANLHIPRNMAATTALNRVSKRNIITWTSLSP